MSAESAVAATDGVQTHTVITIAGYGPRAAVERRAKLPGGDEFTFGVHEQYHDHYGVTSGQFPERTTTNDMFIGSLASCMTGAFALTLEARGVPITSEELEVEAFADVGPAETGEWLVRSVHVVFHLAIPKEDHGTAERVHSFFRKECWLSQTLKGSRCEITSELRLEES